MIRRIGIFGPPCAGKSILAVDIFSMLKKHGIDTELVTEQFRKDVFNGVKIDGAMQGQLFFNQMAAEELPLKKGMEIVVSDCPLMLAAFYGRNESFGKQLFEMARQFDEKYPPLNLFLNQGSHPYNSKGRYHNKTEADVIKNDLFNFLIINNVPAIEVSYQEGINIVMSNLIRKYKGNND